MAHIRKPDWGDYHVRLRVKPDIGDLNLNVVRISDDGRATVSNEQVQRDREMEESWCAAHEELLRRLREHGIANQQTRALAPGEVPVQTVKPGTEQLGRIWRRQTSLHRQRREA
ncbi:MAG: hypothetical protein P9F19_18650 [Candidatus Contendobacter sp.]|nr:hypothetical protein [Candidatus Contendobacter sp.]MDG4559389.1 hypothetical protein [Candidatus Contendobacter sp.]